MKTSRLGNTGIEVSQLAIGTGTSGWAHRSAQTDRGADWLPRIFRRGFELGVTFWDLADQYGSHPHAARTLSTLRRGDLVIATKTTSTDRASCERDIGRFLRELGTEYLDIVLLHAVDSASWPRRARGAMEALSGAKRRGAVRAVGASIHGLGALEAAVGEPWVDVLLVRLNYAGVNMDGPVDKVLDLVVKAHTAGKGIYAMKVLGLGSLAQDPGKAIRFVMDAGCVDAVTVGPTEERHVEELARLFA